MRKLTSAILTLALTLTLSCSFDDGGGDSGSVSYQGKIYKTIKIGNQTWMAENLNYDAFGSKCYEDDPNCAKYGRLYNWVTAMALPSDCNYKSCASQISEKHRGICPTGWHIPSSREWAVLIDYIETQKCDSPTIGCAIAYLKATDGWNSLVSGEEKDTKADWWTTFENDANYAYGWNIKWELKYGFVGFFGKPYYKSSLLSVRCLKDNSKDDLSSSLSTIDAIPFDMDKWFTGNPTDGSCDGCLPLPNNGGFPGINQTSAINTTVHGFGQKGTPIPPERAGELILTAFPNASGTVNIKGGKMSYADWRASAALQKLFGLPPEVSDYGPYGIADPKVQADFGGYAFVKNGFPNESSVGSNGQIAPTRCIADKTKPDEPRFNCLNFSVLAMQPFEITATVYDQKGNFITQYHETVTEKEFRRVVQGPNYAKEEEANVEKLKRNATSDCQAPTNSNYGQKNVLTTNGLVNVNVNIYPFSKEGNSFGNGTYIVKIDRIYLPYEGCANNEGSPLYVEEDYMHYHADHKFDWVSK